MEVHSIVQKAATKTIPKKKKWKKANGWLAEQALQIAEKRREAKEGKEERGKYTQLNAEF